MTKLKIGLVQMRCEKGALSQNIAQIQQYVKEALAQGVDFLCFPEMSITGYIDPAKYPLACLNMASPEVKQVVILLRGSYVQSSYVFQDLIT